jgi:hypothetical protein
MAIDTITLNARHEQSCVPNSFRWRMDPPQRLARPSAAPRSGTRHKQAAAASAFARPLPGRGALYLAVFACRLRSVVRVQYTALTGTAPRPNGTAAGHQRIRSSDVV